MNCCLSIKIAIWGGPQFQSIVYNSPLIPRICDLFTFHTSHDDLDLTILRCLNSSVTK